MKDAVQEAFETGAKEYRFKTEKKEEKKRVIKKTGFDEWGMPDGCPVIPLGKKGLDFFYLDASRQFVQLNYSAHNANAIRALFGEYIHLLPDMFKKFNKEGEQLKNQWDATKAFETLMSACSLKSAKVGLWDMGNRIRGRGAWVDDDGSLCFHYGDSVCAYRDGGVKEEWHKPGEVGRYVYPAYPTLLKPDSGADIKDVLELKSILETWNFRKKTDIRLLIGWIGASHICGALDWRPMIWLTGDFGTGKTTLKKLLENMFGQNILSFTGATEAFVRQTLNENKDVLPVSLDEIEAAEDNRKGAALIELARWAASGAETGKGSADHKAVSFQIRSTFMFSSILVPPIDGQDLSRIHIMDLNRLDEGAVPPDCSRDKMQRISAVIQRRMIAGFSRFKKNLSVLTSFLSEYGVSARSADRYGAMVASYYVLMQDEEMSAEQAEDEARWIAEEDKKEKRSNRPDNELCLEWLLSSRVEQWVGGGKATIGGLISEASGLSTANSDDQKRANKYLMQNGLKFVLKTTLRGDPVKFLFISNNHKGLFDLFRGTKWGMRAGTTGVWMQSLRRFQGASESNALRLDGQRNRGILLPFDVLNMGGSDDDEIE